MILKVWFNPVSHTYLHFHKNEKINNLKAKKRSNLFSYQWTNQLHDFWAHDILGIRHKLHKNNEPNNLHKGFLSISIVVSFWNDRNKSKNMGNQSHILLLHIVLHLLHMLQKLRPHNNYNYEREERKLIQIVQIQNFNSLGAKFYRILCYL